MVVWESESVGLFGPAGHTGLEEGAVDDQLTATANKSKQARIALRPDELVPFSTAITASADAQQPVRQKRVNSSLLRAVAGARSLLRRHDWGGFIARCSP